MLVLEDVCMNCGTGWEIAQSVDILFFIGNYYGSGEFGV